MKYRKWLVSFALADIVLSYAGIKIANTNSGYEELYRLFWTLGFVITILLILKLSSYKHLIAQAFIYPVAFIGVLIIGSEIGLLYAGMCDILPIFYIFGPSLVLSPVLGVILVGYYCFAARSRGPGLCKATSPEEKVE